MTLLSCCHFFVRGPDDETKGPESIVFWLSMKLLFETLYFDYIVFSTCIMLFKNLFFLIFAYLWLRQVTTGMSDECHCKIPSPLPCVWSMAPQHILLLSRHRMCHSQCPQVEHADTPLVGPRGCTIHESASALLPRSWQNMVSTNSIGSFDIHPSALLAAATRHNVVNYTVTNSTTNCISRSPTVLLY